MPIFYKRPSIIQGRDTWTTGSGTIGIYNENGATASNERINATDPFGFTSVIWECRSLGTDNAQGGWASSGIAIDNTKMYRASVWVKRTSSTSTGTFYFGTGSDVDLIQLNNGAGQNNPYWHCANMGGLTQDVWYLWVGHIFPHNYANTIGHSNTGYWTISGGRLGGVNQCNIGASDIKFAPTSTTMTHRAYQYYSTNASDRLQFYNPMIQLCDGSEGTIESLLVNELEVKLSSRSITDEGASFKHMPGDGINLLTDSNNFSGTFNFSSGSVASTNNTNPFGVDNATLVNLTATTWDMYRQKTGLIVGNRYTLSLWAKLGTAANFVVTPNNTAAWSTINAQAVLTTAGWTYVSTTFTCPATGQINMHLGGNPETTNQSAGTVYLYDIKLESATLGATGGVISYVGEWKIHTFTSTSSLVVTSYLGSGLNVDYLIVAGGGGTGYDVGGGGGGGGVLSGYCYLSGGAYTVTVGGGGGSGQSLATRGTTGSDSAFNGLTAKGGGGGGAYNANGTGLNGGSGGGGGGGDGSGSFAAGTTLDSVQGFNGGASSATTWGGGAGGGAGGAGSAGVANTQVAGGAPRSYGISGRFIKYSGGGYGNSDSGTVHPTGLNTSGTSLGRYGFGANGTGAPNASPYSGEGGVVIIRYKYR